MRGDHRPEINSAVQAATRRALEDLGRRLVREVRQRISIRVVKIGYGKGSVVIRSEPGEPPRRESGRLHASIYYRIKEPARNAQSVEVTSSRPQQAYALEYGTARISPRPFFGPSMRAAGGKSGLQREFNRLMQMYLAKELLKRRIVDLPASMTAVITAFRRGKPNA